MCFHLGISTNFYTFVEPIVTFNKTTDKTDVARTLSKCANLIAVKFTSRSSPENNKIKDNSAEMYFRRTKKFI